MEMCGNIYFCLRRVKFVHATEISLLLGAGVLGDALLQVVSPPAQPQEGRRGQHHDRQPEQGGPRGHEVGLLGENFPSHLALLYE